MMNTDPSQTQACYAAYIGIDWGNDCHYFALWAEEGPMESGSVSSEPAELHQWMAQLEERFGGRPVAICLETSNGPIVTVLGQYPWVSLFPVNPVSSNRYRKAFSPSGAKSDKTDAELLLELVRTQREKFSELSWEEPETREIDYLTKARRNKVDDRSRLINKLRSLLKTYYPQAIELVGGDLTTRMALDFLQKWPDLLSLKAARASTVRNFYFAHNVRRTETIDNRLDLIKNTRALTTDETIIKVAKMELRGLLRQLRLLHNEIAEFDKAIQEAFRNHPEAYLFRDLPGAGAQMAPRLLAAFGTQRDKYPDAESLQKAAGIAPVQEQSGRRVWIHWRRNSSTFLRQTFVEWARQTIHWSQWARAFYHTHTKKGKDYNAVVRALAFKWIRILWQCWQKQTPYNEEYYLKQLARRNSPYAVPFNQ